MAELNDKDFRYWKDIVKDDIAEHDSKLNAVNSPDEVINAYMGTFEKFDVGMHVHNKTMIENYLFVSAMTIMPSLFFQLPRIIIRSDRLPFEGSVLTSLVDRTFNEKDKEENQLCIIDTFLPYGYSVMKNGYNSRVGKVKPKPNFFTGKTGGGAQPSDMEHDLEYLKYEKAVSIRQSPKFTYLDHTQPFGKGNRITFKYTRTLQQLVNSNLYDLSSTFLEFFGAKNTDQRKVTIDIYETFIMIGGFAWKLVYTEDWPTPLSWTKTEYEYLPVSYLRFNKMGDVLYNISHGTLGLRAQKELNYLNEVWKQQLDHMRNQTAAHKEAFTEAGQKVLRDNELGGIAWTSKPVTDGILANIQSASPDPRLFENILNVREYLKLLLSTTGGKGGGPESELATTERNKALGDALRSAGMEDAIRGFLVDQIKQRIKNIIRLGNPEMILKLTGENLVNPMTGGNVAPGTELIIGGEAGLGLQDLITGDIDVDFVFDIDMTSAQRPDFPVIRKQLAEGITLATALEPRLNEAGKKLHVDKMLEDYFATLDTVPDAKKYITEMSEQEKERYVQKIQMEQQMAMMSGGKKGGVPSAGSITQSAGKVPTGVERTGGV